LKLVKTPQEQSAEMQKAQAQAMQGSLVNQMGDLAKAPMMDPSKNPEVIDSLRNAASNAQQGNVGIPNIQSPQ